jgi:hypothetical protein
VSRGGIAAQLGGGIGGVSRSVLTNDRGEYTFPKLPAGQYSLTVTQAFYLIASYGQKKPGAQGSQFALADGQQLKVDLQMVHGGVITGTAVGEDGTPAINANIIAWRYAMNSGVRQLQRLGGGSADDRGVYRLHNLQPGDYIVSATPQPDFSRSGNAQTDLIEQAIASGTVQPPAAPGLPATVTVSLPPPGQTGPGIDNTPPTYLPVYYPSTPVPESATVIHVSGSDEHADIDIQVQLVQASVLEGTVPSTLGPDVGIQVSLQNQDPMFSGATTSTRADPTGKFSFRSVAPGKYFVMAQTVAAPPRVTVVNGVPSQQGPPPQLDDSQKLWARKAVTVEGQSSLTVNLALQPGRSISGAIVFDMARPPDLTRTRVTATLAPAPGQSTMGPLPQAVVAADGRFTLAGVVPGKYALRANGPGVLKSSIVNGEDTLDFPMDFTGDSDVTDAVLTLMEVSKLTSLTGTLTDAAGRPAVDYTVIAATSDQKYWTPGSRRIAVSRPGPDGRFTFGNLPAGDYLLAAANNLESGAQFDPEFLKSLTTGVAMHVSVAEGAKVSQDLRVAR